MINIRCHSTNLSHRAALNAAIAEYRAPFPQKKIEIYVGSREIIKAQFRKLYSPIRPKKNHARSLYYFTGLGRLYTDYFWFGKFVFYSLVFLCSLERNAQFIVENLSDKKLLKKLTWKKVYRVNGSGFFENISDNFTNCHVLRKSPNLQKIAYVSRFGKSKYTDRIVLLAKTMPIDKELFIAGFDISGEYFSKTFLKLSKTHPNVKFYGAITDRSKLFSIFKKCDLLIYPSKREGCPFTVFEALTTNTLPIVSCTPGSEDLAADLGTPIIPPNQFQNFDKLEEAYTAFFSSRKNTNVKLPKASTYAFTQVKNQFFSIFKDI